MGRAVSSNGGILVACGSTAAMMAAMTAAGPEGRSFPAAGKTPGPFPVLLRGQKPAMHAEPPLGPPGEDSARGGRPCVKVSFLAGKEQIIGELCH